MLIENAMYFALGALAAALLGLMIMPAVWRRAVRLTRKRIEAATPITMAEFRADKDQLRAEFALSTRRLEMQVEHLRKRLAEQLAEMNRNAAEAAAIRAERERYAELLAELEARETELKARVLELEKQGTDLSQRLRMRDREIASKTTEIEALRESVRGGTPRAAALAVADLSGSYDEDTDRLLTALELERRRADLLDEQARALISRLENSGRRSTETAQAIANMRDALAASSERDPEASRELVAAEARIASAENRLNALLAETSQTVETVEGRKDQSLAEKLSLDEELIALQEEVGAVERAVVADWETGSLEPAELRDRLSAIAVHVSRLVYAEQTDEAGSDEQEESLFDRVQRFAGEDLLAEPEDRPSPPRRGGRLSDRMEALRELQGR